ncbi:type VII secretion protein EssC [Virgibacillus necropolis]|uniref:Type VII secretion protein EssC n=1 Tax=Virgibacillus necropolis TaxID=163877 RepID=A0A221MEM9_9BACI|nr:type VII secretion protein EssC [Virgibacillus necropolis]ASN06084.1 type VII secretion protein EssC [Virgibacillus necropolis]
MKHLWLFYDQVYHYVELPDEQTDVISIGNDIHHIITVQLFTIEPSLTVEIQNDQLVVYQDGNFQGEIGYQSPLTLTIDGHKMTFAMREGNLIEKTFYIGNQQEVNVDDETKTLHYLLFRNEKQWFVKPYQDDIYINGHKIDSITPIVLGDSVFHPYSFMTMTKNDSITIASTSTIPLSLPVIKEPTTDLKQKYPVYRRTPRMVYDLPDDKISFSFPSEEGEDNRRGLMLIIMPPLVMLLVMGMVTLVQPRGIFILISVSMFATTLVTSTIQFFKEKKLQREKKKKRIRLYTRYLENKRDELQKLAVKQRDILYYHFPSFEKMKYLTAEVSNRIWERTMMSRDFLHYRIGRATVPSSYNVSVQSGDMSNQEIDDLLEKSQELVAHYKYVKNVPLTIDLSTGPTGLVGKDSIVKSEIQQIVGQLSFSQSYHDVRFVAIFDEEEYEYWEWMKWLPHFQLPHAYAKGFIYNEQTRDQLLSSIYEILKERDLDNEKDKKMFVPHLIFIVTNRQLISEHVILEYLEGNHTDIGISTIFAADTKESLSENIHTLVRYINEQEGDILIQQQKAIHTPFWLDEHTQADNEKFSRMLRSMNHQLGMSNSIPDKVSFMGLMQVDKAEELQISEKWLKNQSSKTLAVPIGLKGKDDQVFLNLHEKAHGPHGLLAGTTGSGKSEFLQTYILSLAVHFHPHEVAFLLIDYKGGGMAQPFKFIPHLLGTITNIEGNKNFSKRALASIKSELKRRQRLFDTYEVSHISDYTALYKSNEAKEPLPHLFLISDEFAELKNEEPEFIRELVSAARIGRSLGVHLILATQKPGGIIDDQIWSNARFKVALKVQDDSDSKEILKNPDAAKLSVTGRGYLQVGNNEVYELFQSAWSGAPYAKDAFGTEDDVALVTDLGLVPLSDVSAEEGSKKNKITEIEMITKEIAQVQENMDIHKLPSPWLPPLPERLSYSSEVPSDTEGYYIGMIDEPEMQRQTNYSYQPMDDGNIGIFGSSGYGKSTTVLTLLLNFARKNSPDSFQYYIFDFGNGALLPLQQLPHTGDYFRSDDQRKIEKFLVFINDDMERRKQLFRDQEVSNIKMYNMVSEQPLPLLFITLDNFDLVKEEMQDLENKFTQIARDGQSLGIYTILTATRTNAVRQALMSNLKTKIVHYLMDAGEKFTVLGRTQYETEAVQGRAYIQKEESYLAQLFLPTEGENDVEMLENVKQVVQYLKDIYQEAEKPKEIPMLPRKLDFVAFRKSYEMDKVKKLIPIGLDEDSVKPTYMDFQKDKHCLIVGDVQKGKTNILKLILHTMKDSKDNKIAVFDSVNHGLAEYADDEQVVYMETKEQVEGWLQIADAEFLKREEEYRDALNTRKTASLGFEPFILLIDGMDNFRGNIDSLIQSKLANYIKNYSHLGFSIIVTGNTGEFTKGFDPFTNEVKLIKQAILLMRKTDQSMFNLPYTRNEAEIQAGFGYHINSGRVRKIQIPLCESERMTSV